jgi:hypothetical protein
MDDNEVDLQDVVGWMLDWIDLVRGSDTWPPFVHLVMTFCVPKAICNKFETISF